MSPLKFIVLPANLLRPALLCLLSSLAVPAAGQSRAFEDCQNIVDRAARFTCYDQVESSTSSQTVIVPDEEDRKPFYRRLLPFGADNDEAQVVDNATATTAAHDETDDDQVASFGRRERDATARLENGSDGTRELVDNIAGIKLVQHQTWQITLSSGQVWRQMINRRYALKLGDQVRLQSTGFGNAFRLSADRLAGSGFIQVERIDNN